MKRSVKIIIVAVVVAAAAAIFGIRLMRDDAGGSPTPRVQATANDAGELDLQNLKGKYVIVNYWDSSNAVSRIATGEYDRFVRDHPLANVALVSVNTDPNRDLFTEIVRKDGLESAYQYHLTDTKATQLQKGYRPTEGFVSYLVDPEGKIVARNPSVATVEHYVDPPRPMAKN